MADLDFYLDRAAKAAGPVKVTSGQSGYFSAPADGLDPHLFDGTHLKPSVRTWILNTLYSFWDRKYKTARSWSTVWLAGSGISYQWAANRGNGDLDVLIGVQWPAFVAANPTFRGLTEQQMADKIDVDLKTELWPRTKYTRLNGQTYEVTFFVNAAGADIRNINPYAAYNLTTGTWTITPPKLPANPATLYPAAYRRAIAGESRTASALIERYNALSGDLKRHPVGSPGHINTTTALRTTTAQAAALFDDIHTGRRAAFGPGGSGYGDWNNYRWQAHKQAGTVQALFAVAAAGADAQTHLAARVYGRGQIETADQLITRAILTARGIA